MAVAEQFGSDEEQFGGIERELFADQPLVAVVVGHVVRGQEDDVVLRGVELAIGAVDDFGLRKGDAGLRFGNWR